MIMARLSFGKQLPPLLWEGACLCLLLLSVDINGVGAFTVRVGGPARLSSTTTRLLPNPLLQRGESGPL
jgi:hypothetical protein